MKSISIFILFILPCFAYGQITLSEMQSSNSSTIADEMGDYDDWIELHNPTSESIEIGGLVLKDQVDTWSIPTGDPSTLIPPGGFFHLWADDQEFQGVFHTNFKISSDGEFLGLYEADGITVIDSITIPPLNTNSSYIKCNNEWFITNSPTPTAENDCSVNVIEKDLGELISIKHSGNRKLHVLLNFPLNGKEKLQIYSLTGSLVLEKEIFDRSTSIDLTNIEETFVVIRFSNGDKDYSKKIFTRQKI